MKGLFECLEGIAIGQADDSILDKYDEVRRSIFNTVIDPTSTSNFLRISTLDTDDAIEKDPFISMCAAAKRDPTIKEKIDNVPLPLLFVSLAILKLCRASMLLVMTLHNTIRPRLK